MWQHRQRNPRTLPGCTSAQATESRPGETRKRPSSRRNGRSASIEVGRGGAVLGPDPGEPPLPDPTRRELSPYREYPRRRGSTTPAETSTGGVPRPGSGGSSSGLEPVRGPLSFLVDPPSHIFQFRCAHTDLRVLSYLSCLPST